MDQKAKEESRKAAQQKYHAKIKKELTFCNDCNKQVATPSWRKHIVSNKHLQNCFKERKTFFEEFQDLYNLLSVEGSDIRRIFCDMHDLIEGEYYDEQRQEILSEEERYTDPTPFARNDREKDFCGTIFYMEQQIQQQFTMLHNTRPFHVDITYLEKKEAYFENLSKNVDDKDLKKKLLWCFQDLLQPWPADKTAEMEHKKQLKWEAARKAQEEAIRQKDEMAQPVKKAKAVVVVVQKPKEEEEDEEDDYDDSEPFPTYSTFLRLKNKTKNKILGFIGDNFLHIFDRIMTDLLDIVEFKKTQDYNEAYRFVLLSKNDYDDRQNANDDSMDCSDIAEEEEEEEEEEM
jgi:hypothetical protein